MVSAYSPVTRLHYALSCASAGKWVDCVTGLAEVRITIRGGGIPSNATTATTTSPAPAVLANTSTSCAEFQSMSGTQQNSMLLAQGYPASYLNVMNDNGQPELISAYQSDCSPEPSTTLADLLPVGMDTDIGFPWWEQTQLSPSPCELEQEFKTKDGLGGELMCHVSPNGAVAGAPNAHQTITTQTGCGTWSAVPSSQMGAGFLNSIGWPSNLVGLGSQVMTTEVCSEQVAYDHPNEPGWTPANVCPGFSNAEQTGGFTVQQVQEIEAVDPHELLTLAPVLHGAG
jgi:hypothetical protein